MRSAPPARAAVTMLQAVSVTTTGVLPAFLLGALAVQIRDDLSIGPAQIGLAAAVLFAVAGLLARPLGKLVQRIGAGRGMVISASLAAASLTGIAVTGTYAVLIIALAVGGAANAMAQPAANLSISRAVSPERLGLAFGIKQSSIPAASLLAGLAVPGIALVLGWRWAFVLGAALAVGLALWALFGGPRVHAAGVDGDSEPDRGTPRGGLLVLTLGAALAAAAATSLGVFLVDSAVQSGMEPGTAGLLFAGSALAGLLIRIVLGAAMDRHPRRSPYVLIANLLALGTLGYLLVGSGSSPWLAVGAFLIFCAGWSWPGLLHFAVVRDNRLAAASATGVLQTGLSLGAAAGPLLFGLLVEATSYQTAWFTAGAVSLAAAVTFRIGRFMIRRSRGLAAAHTPSPAPPAPSTAPSTRPKVPLTEEKR